MKVLNRLLALVLVMMVMGAIPRASSAQGPMIEFRADDGWKCHPATTNGTVVGFLVEQVAGSVAPNGFNVVWYERAGDEFVMTIGWKDTAVLEAAVKVATTHGQADLFSNAAIGPDVLESIRSCDVVAADGVTVQSGLAVDDPLQPIAAQLPPDVMEVVVEFGAAGATA
jgi:hypothetical protein